MKCSFCASKFIFGIANQLEEQKDIYFPYYFLALIRLIKERIMIYFFNDKEKML